MDVDIAGDVAALSPSLTSLPITFGVAQREDPWFTSAPWDGMLGMALANTAFVLDSMSVMQRMATDANLPSVFGMYLTMGYGWNGSSMTIGGYDSSAFYDPSSAPVYAPLLQQGQPTGMGSGYDYWRFHAQHLTVYANPTVNNGGASWGDAVRTSGMLESQAMGPYSANTASSPSRPSDAPASFVPAQVSSSGGSSVDLCSGSVYCAAVLSVSSGTIGLPLDMLASFIYAVNASVGGGCVVQRQVPPGDHHPHHRWSDDVGNVPWQPWYVFCPDNTTGVGEGDSTNINRVMPNVTVTISSHGDDADDSGSDGSDATDGWWDLLVLPHDYCVKTWAMPWPGGEPMDAGSHGDNTRHRTGYLPTPPEPAAPAGMCRLMVTGVTGSLYGGAEADLILGAPFLRAFYTIYDAGDGNPADSDARAGFGATKPGTINPSVYTPAAPSFWGSKAMWAAVIGCAVAGVIAGGVFVVVRDRRREKASRQLRDQHHQGLKEGLLMSENSQQQHQQQQFALHHDIDMDSSPNDQQQQQHHVLSAALDSTVISQGHMVAPMSPWKTATLNGSINSVNSPAGGNGPYRSSSPVRAGRSPYHAPLHSSPLSRHVVIGGVDEDGSHPPTHMMIATEAWHRQQMNGVAQQDLHTIINDAAASPSSKRERTSFARNLYAETRFVGDDEAEDGDGIGAAALAASTSHLKHNAATSEPYSLLRQGSHLRLSVGGVQGSSSEAYYDVQ